MLGSFVRRKRAGIAAAALLVMAAGAAHADGLYYGMGLGGGAELEGDFADRFSGDDEVAGRVVLGRRWGEWAIEGVVFGTDLNVGDGRTGSYSTVAVGVDARYFIPITGGLELYLRGGLNYTWLEPMDDTVALIYYSAYDGRGAAYGTGLQWRSGYVGNDTVRVRLAAWADFTKHVAVVRPEYGGGALRGAFEMLTFGVSVGSDL